MIVNFLHKSEKYHHLHPAFPAAFEYFRSIDPGTLSPGRHVIDGESLYILIERTQGKGISKARLEAHRKYIDIQYIVEGGDTIGILPLSLCSLVEAPYDENRDIEYFADQPVEWVSLPAGSFIIFYPDDAHAPLAGQGEVVKAIAKIAV